MSVCVANGARLQCRVVIDVAPARTSPATALGCLGKRGVYFCLRILKICLIEIMLFLGGIVGFCWVGGVDKWIKPRPK